MIKDPEEPGAPIGPRVRLLKRGDLDWQDDAACASSNPDLFFPERGASVTEAKAVCNECPVQGDCLEYALASKEKFGIWGGMSERERRRVRRDRRQERFVLLKASA